MASGICRLLAACATLGVLATAGLGEVVHVCFQNGDNAVLVERVVPPGATPLETAIHQLVAGPTDGEARQGVISHIPSGTRVVQLRKSSETVSIDLSAEVLVGLDDAALMAIFDQVRITLVEMPGASNIRLTCAGELLCAYLPPPPRIAPAPVIRGERPALGGMAVSLGGRTVAIGPSHGYLWNGSGWSWQRSDPCAFGEAVLEDTNSIRLAQFLQQYLVQDGATVHVPRELNEDNCCHSTGQPWWKMAARYWLQGNGTPSWVWDSSDTDLNDDIRCRPLYADYRDTDIYVACHTNAGGGTANGTETYRDTAMTYPAHVANSLTLATSLQNSVVSAIREMYDAGWSNRGVKDAAGSLTEIRIPDRPACLIELAFHDNCGRDGQYLTDNFFRSVTEWAAYRGICQYFGVAPTWDRYSDEFVSDTIPTVMNAGESYDVSVTFRNRGVVWSAARGFGLGAVGDSDPFTAATRVAVSEEVRPGSTYTFAFTMTAPAAGGTFTTDWQMVRDGVAWFGATLTKSVTVNATGPTPPVIVQQPAGLSVPTYGTATLTVDAAGTPPLSYQWQKDSSNLGDGGKISGAATPTLWIVNAEDTDVAGYRCVVTNDYGSVASSPALLTVTPGSVTVESRAGGQNVGLYSESGVWADSGGKSTAPGLTPGIGSRYSSTLFVDRTAAFAFGSSLAAAQYEVFVTWGDTANRRAGIVYTVLHAAGSTQVTIDQSATSNAWVSLGKFGFSPGVSHNVTVTPYIGVSGSAYTDAAKWEYAGDSPPTITLDPAAQDVCPGGAATFTVSAVGQGVLTYHWQRNGADLNDGDHYAGTTTATLTVLDANAGIAQAYGCVVTNAHGSATSSSAPLTLRAGTIIAQQPQSQEVPAGAAVTFSVVATGDGALTYQWQKDDVDINSATSDTLQLMNVDRADAGSYRCIVAGACGSATSDEAALTIHVAAGDLDEDGDSDLNDFAQFQTCFNGPNRPPAQPHCGGTDFDGDNDVDLNDFAVFQTCFNGPNRRPACL